MSLWPVDRAPLQGLGSSQKRGMEQEDPSIHKRARYAGGTPLQPLQPLHHPYPPIHDPYGKAAPTYMGQPEEAQWAGMQVDGAHGAVQTEMPRPWTGPLDEQRKCPPCFAHRFCRQGVPCMVAPPLPYCMAGPAIPHGGHPEYVAGPAEIQMADECNHHGHQHHHAEAYGGAAAYGAADGNDAMMM
jgi:hypothetical protein